MANSNTTTQVPLTNDVELEQVKPQHILSIREIIQVADLPQMMGNCIPELLSYLQQEGAQPAGPLFVRYHTFGETETDMEIGIPVVNTVAGEGRITAGELPGGPAVTTWHLGPHDKLGEAYARLSAWSEEHEREPDGPTREVYYWIDPRQNPDPSLQVDPANWRTQLVQPIK